MGFLDAADKGSEALSNINIDYERTGGFTTIKEYGDYLTEILAGLGENSPNGPGVNDIAAYISAACLRKF